MLRLALVNALAAALTVGPAGFSRAEDPRPGVLSAAQRESERKAQAAFAAGRYEESVEIYANLWAEHHDPIYLRNIGRCYQRQRNPDRAIASFEEYLAKARRLTAPERRDIEGYIRDLRLLKEQQERAVREAAPPPPDRPADRVAAPPPAPAAAVPAPAPMLLSRPEASSSTAAAPIDEGGRLWRRVGIGALVAAGGLAIAGGGLLWSSWSRYDDANNHCVSGGAGACEAAADAIKTRNWASRFLFAGAALAAVAGGTLIYLHPARETGATGLVVGAARVF
jgi:tetratricopeptide (TPR) repeat protein